MATTNELVHTNLVNLTGRLAGGVPEGDIHDDLTGLAAMAGNEGEAAAADMVQTLSFTTWIQDICDGYKQEKELDVGTTEYNENAATIRKCIQNINNLGNQLGIQGDVIPTPKNGKEVEAAASAVYRNFALPYEAGAKIDYAKYMQLQDGLVIQMKGTQRSPEMAQTQEIGQQMQRAMRRLNAAVAQSPQYGVHAKNYWNAVQQASSHYNAQCGEFLDSMDSLDNYTRQFEEAKGFLAKEEDLSSAGMSDFQMGGAAADKIDFEGDDAALQSNLRETITKADKLIKTERAMLVGGHIDSKRRALFEQTLKGYIKEMKGEQADIEADNAVDIQATAELEQQMKEKPQDVTEENAQKYYEMVEKQQTMGPSLHKTDLEKMAQVASLGIGAMNTALIASGVTPIGLNMASAVALAKVGKFAYDMNKFMSQEHAPEAKVKEASLDKGIDLDRVPTYKGHKEVVEEPTTEKPAIPISKKFAMAVKRKATDFAERMRTAIREYMTEFDEQAPDYEANEQFKETIEHYIGTIVDENGCVVAESVSSQNQSKNLVGLDAAMVMGTGEHIFDKDPQDMTDDELKVYSSAVTAVMGPMKDENGKYLSNFSDCYAVGEEVMPEAQQEYTDATTSLMVVGQPDAAVAVRESQTELIACSTEYQQLSDDGDFTHVEDDSAKYAEIQDRADAADGKARHMMDVYRPLVAQAGIIGATAAYQKHEYNKAWKESCRERNLQLMCQGTIQSMEKSAQENHMLNHERLYGQHGLLRA